MIKEITQACNGCGVCVLACRKDLIKMEQSKGRRKGIAYFTEPRECVVCRWCELICPVNAVHVDPEIPLEAFRKHLPKFHELASI